LGNKRMKNPSEYYFRGMKITLPQQLLMDLLPQQPLL
jgi:hypothetical protein